MKLIILAAMCLVTGALAGNWYRSVESRIEEHEQHLKFVDRAIQQIMQQATAIPRVP